MPDQATITDELVNQAARIVAHEHGSDVFDDDHQRNEYTDVQIDLYRSVAQLVLADAAPHIAAQALRHAATELDEHRAGWASTHPHQGFSEGLSTASIMLKQLAADSTAGRPGSAAPTPTDPDDDPNVGISEAQIAEMPEEDITALVSMYGLTDLVTTAADDTLLALVAARNRGWNAASRDLVSTQPVDNPVGLACGAEHPLPRPDDRRCVQRPDHVDDSPLHFNRAGFAWSDADAKAARVATPPRTEPRGELINCAACGSMDVTLADGRKHCKACRTSSETSL